MNATHAYLAGDIGGTKALLALCDCDEVLFERRYACDSFESFAGMLQRFVEDARLNLGAACTVKRACLGIAAPVEARRARMTNRSWEIDAQSLEREFGIDEVLLRNDFAAAACGLDALAAADLVTLQSGAPDPEAPRLLLGAGTGLGVALLIGRGAALRVIAGEGGHAGFAPADELQDSLCRYLRGVVGRVEREHVISGSGLEHVYTFLRDAGRRTRQSAGRKSGAAPLSAPAITRAALEQGETLALAALDLFISCYGSAAGDLALTVLARGGVYIAGGIAPKILPRLRGGGFISAFNAKGSFAGVARACPVHVVTNEKLALIGAAAIVRAVPESPAA